MNIAEQVRTNLKKYRETAQMNTSELARRSGVSRTHIGQIERGESVPTIEIVQQLAQGLGLTIETLLGLNEKKSMEKKRTELTGDHDRDHRRTIVEWRVGAISHAPFVAIDDLEGGPYSNAAQLTPEEALNLLMWLEQEKERLQEALLTEFRIEIQQGPGMA